MRLNRNTRFPDNITDTTEPPGALLLLLLLLLFLLLDQSSNKEVVRRLINLHGRGVFDNKITSRIQQTRAFFCLDPFFVFFVSIHQEVGRYSRYSTS